jgi:hypothetical protein
MGLNEYTDRNRISVTVGNSAKYHQQKQVERYITKDFIGGRIKRVERYPVTINITWIEKNRKRDPDNIAFAKKFIFDALVNMGIMRNDGYKEVAALSDKFDVDKDNPRILVEIVEAGE